MVWVSAGPSNYRTMDKNIFSPLKPKLGVSACLLGRKVRWDGRHKYDWYIRDVLGKYFDIIGICPETECGLGVPREPIRLEGAPDTPRVVTLKSRIDITAMMQEWIRRRLDELEGSNLCGFVFKAKSPSCGLKTTMIFDKNHIHTCRRGIFAAALLAKFPHLPAAEETDLHDPLQKAVFLEAVCRFVKTL